MAKYLVLKGINYPPSRRAEIGDVVEDMSPQTVKYFLADNAIELVESKKASKNVVEAVDPEITSETVSEPVVVEEVVD